MSNGIFGVTLAPTDDGGIHVTAPGLGALDNVFDRVAVVAHTDGSFTMYPDPEGARVGITYEAKGAERIV